MPSYCGLVCMDSQGLRFASLFLAANLILRCRKVRILTRQSMLQWEATVWFSERCWHCSGHTLCTSWPKILHQMRVSEVNGTQGILKWSKSPGANDCATRCGRLILSPDWISTWTTKWCWLSMVFIIDHYLRLNLTLVTIRGAESYGNSILPFKMEASFEARRPTKMFLRANSCVTFNLSSRLSMCVIAWSTLNDIRSEKEFLLVFRKGSGVARNFTGISNRDSNAGSTIEIWSWLLGVSTTSVSGFR